MKYLPVLLTLLMLTGCYNVRTPLVSYDAPSAAPTKPSEEKPHKKTFKEEYGMSETVAVLLGLGAVFMATGLGSAYHEGETSDNVALIFGGTGLLLWGSAGIVYGVEE